MSWHGEYKLPGGKLIVCDFAAAGDTIADFQLSGDFFLEPDTLLDTINQAVNGLALNSSINEIAAAITAVLRPEDQLLGVTPAGIGTCVRRALSNAASWRDYEWELVHDQVRDPLLNAALDEVLTQEVAAGRRPPTLRIWEGDTTAVYIGSFQSVKNEVDIACAAAANIPVVRRISGGGAMYMRPADCITYALYVPAELVSGLSFADSYAFLDEWVLEALHSLGVDASYVPLNDITSPRGKIGGAAQKRFGSGGVLHHVTLAYDMQQDMLQQVLRIGREKLSDKGIKSAAKRVDPLRVQTAKPRAEIVTQLLKTFQLRHGGKPGAVTDSEVAAAAQLVTDKFATDKWLYRVP